jgi:hypothetical protein
MSSPAGMTVFAVLLTAAIAHADEARSGRRAVTDQTGAYVSPQSPTTLASAAPPPSTDALLWTFDTGFSIPESVSLATAGAQAWAGLTLNDERLLRFQIPGDDAPDLEYFAQTFSPAIVHAADNADIALFLDGVHGVGPYTVRAFSSGSGDELWSHDFPAQFDSGGADSVRISDDGRTGVVYLANTGSGGALFVFDAQTGDLLHQFNQNVPGAGVDLTGDGALALLTQSDFGRVIDTKTGKELFAQQANGAGGRFRISGNGDVILLGGFDLRVFKRAQGGDTWGLQWTFKKPVSWYGWGSAVSVDGSTIGVMSHNWGGNYLDTTTYVFDIGSNIPLGQYDTFGSGNFQDSVSGAAISDDGSVLAVSSWGTQHNEHPEVMIFDRSVNLIGSVDTPGSPFGLDLSTDGRYVLVGSKAIHANETGNGGQVRLYEVETAGCYADFTGDGALDLFDFLAYVNAFNAAEDRADCTEDGAFDFFDFLCFTNAFNQGC